jgi:acetyl/propionyl-CoA carboxylase alpha subunit
VDYGVYSGWIVPTDYDRMLGKLIAWGRDREEAIARLRGALGEYHVAGIRTNVRLFQRILSETDFLQGDVHTKWLDALLPRPEQNAGESDANAEDAGGGTLVNEPLGRNRLQRTSNWNSSEFEVERAGPS